MTEEPPPTDRSGPTLGPIGAMIAVVLLTGIGYLLIDDVIGQVSGLTLAAWKAAIGGLCLLPFATPNTPGVWRDGISGGLLLGLAFGLQLTGMETAPVINAALLTGTSIVLAPVAASLMRRVAPRPWALIAVALAAVGIVRLLVDGVLQPGSGDLLLLGGAAAFAGHLTFTAAVAGRHRIVPLTGLQLLTAGIALGVASVVLGSWQIPPSSTWSSIVVLGVGVTGAAYLVQVWAQMAAGAHLVAWLAGWVPLAGVIGAIVLGSELGGATEWLATALILGAIQVSLTRAATPETLAALAVEINR